MNLTDWAARLIGVLETDGATTDRFTLETPHDGEVWYTWHRPVTAEQLDSEVQLQLRHLENQFPKRKIPVQVVAHADREVIARYPMTVTGTQQGGHLDAQSQATATAFDTMVTSIEKLSRLMNTQVDQARLMLETINEERRQYAELATAYRIREVMGDGQENSSDAMKELIMQHGKPVLELLTHLLAERVTKGPNKNA